MVDQHKVLCDCDAEGRIVHGSLSNLLIKIQNVWHLFVCRLIFELETFYKEKKNSPKMGKHVETYPKTRRSSLFG